MNCSLSTNKFGIPRSSLNHMTTDPTTFDIKTEHPLILIFDKKENNDALKAGMAAIEKNKDELKAFINDTKDANERNEEIASNVDLINVVLPAVVGPVGAIMFIGIIILCVCVCRARSTITSMKKRVLE